MANLFYSQVKKFQQDIIGYDVPKQSSKLPDDVKELTIVQLREEIQELQDSHTLTDEVDALIDLIYFAYGGLVKMGIPEDTFAALHTIVHNANMTKVAGKKATRDYEGTAVDAVKPTNFMPPEKVICRFLNDEEFINEYEVLT